MSYSSMNTINTVAGREIKTALRSKSIIITIALTLVLVIGGIIAASFFADDDSEPARLGVVGVQAPVVDAATRALGQNAGVVTESMTESREDAISQVKNEDVAAVLLKTDKGFDLITDGDASPEVMGAASTIASTLSQGTALQRLGISPQQFAEAMPPAEITTVNVKDDNSSEVNMPAVVMVMIGSSLMSLFIILFAANIGGRVTEEKSSRVVEIILSTVRPLDFLAGKILGNTVFGLIAAAIVLGAGAITVSTTNVLDGFPFDYGILGLMLLAFVLGMLLFGSLYAAAGSMVSRTEDLQSTQMPVMILIFGMIYTPVFGWNSLDSTVMQVLTWIPPFSLPTIPLQVAAGNMSYPLALVDYAVSAVVIVLLMVLVSKIYQRSILHNGKKMSWAKALTAKA
ncbi:ABC transporter permease [Corynebacterium falsenii]|uniref:ABC transporter permease n=1 Tax=Corynebacterium falsenii TaxID=108486 RepID=A0A418Q5Q3_9CORY|nr:ABC transporter permease [Corynebacterium falsenii]RIX33998.1 ABC transporter permease [Corynebacterium falsenii]HJF12371.1 ABC transporter permease [Corynebacterium falsenii]